MLFPALVAKHIDLRNDADMILGTGLYDLFYFGIRQGQGVDQLRMRFKLIMIVDEHE